MSYEAEESGKCDICGHHGPRSMFVVVPEEEAIARAKEEFALTGQEIPANAPYWRMFHDPNYPVPECMALTCPPGQHLAWRLVNGCPKWELDEQYARWYWNLDARGRETNYYRVKPSNEVELWCYSCVHAQDVRDAILNPAGWLRGCDVGMDTNPHREVFQAQLSRKRYNIYDPPRGDDGEIIPPADDEPLFILGGDPLVNVYLWQFSGVRLIFHNEEVVKRGQLPVVRWSIDTIKTSGLRIGDPQWATVFALINLGVPDLTGLNFRQRREAVNARYGADPERNGWAKRQINRHRKKLGLPAWSG